MSRRQKTWLSMSAVACLLAAGGHAHAGDRARCAKAYESAQMLRRSGAMLESKGELAVCIAECTTVKGDCARWLEETERAIPSVVIAVSHDGGDVDRGVAATIDGATIVLDGRALELNPGPHKVEVTFGDRKAVTSFVLREGEKSRRIELALPAPQATSAATTAPTQPPTPTAPPMAAAEAPRIPWQTTVFGAAGLSVAALGASAWLVGRGRYQDLERCRPDCASSDVTTTRAIYAVGDVAIVLGVAALATATYFLVRPRHGPRAARALTIPVTF